MCVSDTVGNMVRILLTASSVSEADGMVNELSWTFAPRTEIGLHLDKLRISYQTNSLHFTEDYFTQKQLC